MLHIALDGTDRLSRNVSN